MRMSIDAELELNTDNPLGTGGVLANAYANLIRVMWSGTETCTVPRQFKMAVAQLNSEFGECVSHVIDYYHVLQAAIDNRIHRS
jgi:ubiquitin C-terminal hydrolase